MALAALPPRPALQSTALQTQKQDFQSLVLSCNKDGMDSLRKGQLKAAFEQFKYAEAILIANQAEGESTNLLAVTCNNLGCYYKKTGKLHGALSYLRRALKMEQDLGTDEVTVAGTHLNICAILSKLEKHDKAAQHAQCALELIRQRVDSAEPEKVSQDDYSVLAIAYHNVAVERDFLHDYDKAAEAFQQGHQVAKRCLGEDHPLSATLGKNCESVLMKSQKLANLSSATAMSSSRTLMKDRGLLALPSLSGSGGPASDPAEEFRMPQSVRQEAANWVESEETAWSTFANRTMVGGQAATASTASAPKPPADPRSASNPASWALRDVTAREIGAPQFHEAGYRDIPFTTSTLKTPFLKKSGLGQAIEMNPDALMDIIDVENGNHAVAGTRSAPNDYRPNRMIKGTTRTARVVRRTGLLNSTTHRDQVMTGRNLNATATQKTAYQRRMAAERIQRVWRSWYKYCQENHDWMTTTWIAATMIQANWRSYHVRRQKLDRASTCIQRHARGFLVRKILKKHSAAVTIQRHVVGMLTRIQLRKLQKSATKIQALALGAAARRRVRKKRAHFTRTVLTITCAFRQFRARHRVGGKRAARDQEKARCKAATDIQRLFRGCNGRKRAAEFRAKYLSDLERYQAATKLQAMARRDAAIKRVDQIRVEELEMMNRAATTIRKLYLGYRSRRRYKQLLTEFTAHEAHVKTIQRYGRGFLVRLRMWREAIRAELELWAAMEMQRAWRGLQGRLRWEDKYHQVWLRETAAVRIQRNIRGWCARCRVGRMRRRLARAEFERARRRFRSAQRLQALARGMLCRKVTRARREQKIRAVTQIQRIWRGHCLRMRLWVQVIELRATMIQSAMRGCLVRNRRFHLIAITICIQQKWRQHVKKPTHVRQAARQEMIERKNKATVIQKRFRQNQESKAIGRIQEGDAASTESAVPRAAK